MGSAITNIFDSSLDAIAPVELVAFSAEVNLPTNAKSLTASDVSVSSFVGDGDTVINNQGASLLTAENAQGNTLMLSYTIPQQAQVSASAKSYNTAERLYLT